MIELILGKKLYLRNKTRDICSVPEDMRERVREARSSLHSRIRRFTSVITLSDTKNTSKLIIIYKYSPSGILLDSM